MRHDRQAEGHPAHDRRLPARRAYTTTKYVFDLRDDDVYWCTADVGWVTGHSYVVYGPLANGATVLMYEGAPELPEPDRFWEIIERYGVTIFYTAPTAIRAFMSWGDEYPAKHDLSSLRLLGSVGEPINPEAWMWYRTMIGGERCPIVDTWWQTETGAIMITPLPGATPTKPGSATRPFLGVVAEVVDKRRQRRARSNEGGYLVIKQPWPSMLRTICGDPERYEKTYFGEVPGVLLRRRRRAPRRGRLLLGPGPRRRRASTSPAIGSAPSRSRARWSPTRTSPRPQWSAAPTSSRARRSSRS